MNNFSKIMRAYCEKRKSERKLGITRYWKFKCT